MGRPTPRWPGGRRSRSTPCAWRVWFAEKGVSGVGSPSRGRGRKSNLTEETVDEILRATATTGTPDGGTRWTTRLPAGGWGARWDPWARGGISCVAAHGYCNLAVVPLRR